MAEFRMTDTVLQQDVEKKEKIMRGKRLMRIRGMIKISRAVVAKKYGISADTLKNWELGRSSGLTEQGAKRVLSAFQKAGVQCSIGWLLHGLGTPPIILDESSVHSSPHSTLNLAEETTPYVIPPPEIQFFCEHYANAFYMQVADEAMQPYYAQGDYVAGVRCYQNEIATLIGKYCIVETQAGEVFLRLLRAGSKEGLFALQPTDVLAPHAEPYLYDIELLSAAAVVLHRRMNY